MDAQSATLPVMKINLTAPQVAAICAIGQEVVDALELIYSNQEFGTVVVTVKPGEFQVVVTSSTKGSRPTRMT